MPALTRAPRRAAPRRAAGGGAGRGATRASSASALASISSQAPCAAQPLYTTSRPDGAARGRAQRGAADLGGRHGGGGAHGLGELRRVAALGEPLRHFLRCEALRLRADRARLAGRHRAECHPRFVPGDPVPPGGAGQRAAAGLSAPLAAHKPPRAPPARPAATSRVPRCQRTNPAAICWRLLERPNPRRAPGAGSRPVARFRTAVSALARPAQRPPPWQPWSRGARRWQGVTCCCLRPGAHTVSGARPGDL
jgi:hypothetical protein